MTQSFVFRTYRARVLEVLYCRARIMTCISELFIVLLAFGQIIESVDPGGWPCNPLPYAYYWNVGEADPPSLNPEKFFIFSANYTQTGNGCSTPRCVPWSQGLFPTITDSGHPVNGGVPQNANLTAHVEELEKTVAHWIPDPNWEGNAVLDFESWTTVWELNNDSGNWHSIRYQNYSIFLEKQKHPTWSKEQIEAEAKKSFEASASKFFVETLNTCRKMRPKVSVLHAKYDRILSIMPNIVKYRRSSKARHFYFQQNCTPMESPTICQSPITTTCYIKTQLINFFRSHLI